MHLWLSQPAFGPAPTFRAKLSLSQYRPGDDHAHNAEEKAHHCLSADRRHCHCRECHNKADTNGAGNGTIVSVGHHLSATSVATKRPAPKDMPIATTAIARSMTLNAARMSPLPQIEAGELGQIGVTEALQFLLEAGFKLPNPGLVAICGHGGRAGGIVAANHSRCLQ